MTPAGVWAWHGWWWDPRSLHWLPSWRNAVLRATAVEGAGYWRVTSGRAYGTGDTFGQAWSAMCALARDAADRNKALKVTRRAPFIYVNNPPVIVFRNA